MAADVNAVVAKTHAAPDATNEISTNVQQRSCGFVTVTESVASGGRHERRLTKKGRVGEEKRSIKNE